MSTILATIILTSFLIWLFSLKKPPLVSKNLGLTSYTLAASQAFVLSLAAGYVVWDVFRAFPQHYNDFISGAIGDLIQNKSAEYYALYLSIISFIFFFYILCWIYSWWESNSNSLHEINKISFYSLLPSAMMIGQWLRIRETLYLLWLSSLSILLGLVLILIMHSLIKNTIAKVSDIDEIGKKIISIFFFFALSGVGAVLFIARVGCSRCKFETEVVWIFLVILIVFIVSRARNSLAGKLNTLIVFSQIGIPFLLSAFLSPPLLLKNGEIGYLQYNQILFAMLIGACALSWVDIYKRGKNVSQGDKWKTLFSPFVFLILLVSLQPTYTGWPSISQDDYHAGEFYLPWWLFERFNYLPYIDYQPTRGLINYVPGFLSWLFYDNSLSGQAVISNLFSSIYIIMGFVIIQRRVGNFAALLIFFSLLPLDFGGISGGVYLIIIALIILFEIFNRYNSLVTFWTWLGLSFFLLLYQITEAIPFVLCTLPLGCYILLKSYVDLRKNLLISLGMLVIGSIVLIVNATTRDMGISILRYIFEQASINDVAHGLPWQYPPGGEISQMITNGPLWQFISFSWILLIIPIVYRLTVINNKNAHTDVFLLITYLILCVALIPRSAGRIDPIAYSRPYLTSVVLVICGLPLLFLPLIKDQHKKAPTLLAMAVVFGLLGSQERFARSPWDLLNQTIQEPSQTVSGSDIGLDVIGHKVLMDKAQIERQLQIKSVLGRILRADETYYDLTNHNSDYAFQMRPNPVMYTAFYNSPATSQQLRTVDVLGQKAIPLVLVDGENILHDGGSLSLRSYYIYRYLLDEYLPFQDEFGRIWMIRKTESYRLSKTSYHIGTDQEAIDLLSQVFWQENLEGLPASWGRSYKSLNARLGDPIDIQSIANINNSHALLQLNGWWKSTGKNSWLVFELPPDIDGDMLYLEIKQNGCDGPMRILWTTDAVQDFTEKNSFIFDFSGSQFLIPISSAPSWALSDKIIKVRIDIPYKGCQVSINKFILYKRVTSNE